MSKRVEVTLPDIGDFTDVDVVEVLVAPDSRVNKDDSLISLESDKATLEVPSPYTGLVKTLAVKVGDKVSEGALILTMEVEEEGEAAAKRPPPETPPQEETVQRPSEPAVPEIETEVVVLGAGPGGYTAAFRAADLGKKVVLIERYPVLGGVCLNVGCIPSKALLHVAKVIDEAAEMGGWGVDFGKPRIDLNRLRDWKAGVVGRLTGGLNGLTQQRKVKVIQGVGRFTSAHQLTVEGPEGPLRVAFEQAIIAVGSQPTQLPGVPEDDPRMLDSTSALALQEVPDELLVIGGGIIGLEMATVYHALGARISVVELTESLLPGCDRDLVRPLHKRLQRRYEALYLSTQVTRIESWEDGLLVHFMGSHVPETRRFDKVLVAVGRRPNGKEIAAEKAGVRVNDAGFIDVDTHQRTNVPHIFAIGDVVGQPMLAHKATHEGKVAAEVIAGMKRAFDARVIPNVAYTDPEVAWVGVSETQAEQRRLNYAKGVFPWAASGRSLALGRDEGVTKILFDRETGQVIGAGIVGPGAGDLIAEIGLAIEMGCDAEDIALTIHPHPTLSETVAMSAEAFAGTITDLYLPRK